MNMVATDAEAPVVDANILYEQACSVIDLVHPGGKLSPLEPSEAEPSPDAVLLSGEVEGVNAVFLIDGTSTSEEFDAAEVITGLADRLAEIASLTVTPLSHVSGEDLAPLAASTTFRSGLTAVEEELGELRFIAAALAGEPAAAAATDEAPPASTPAESPAQEPEATASELAERLPNLAAVDMNVAVELGRVRLPIRELLGLGTGSVIRLGTPVGESFDILVNGKPAARGDLVVVGGRLAVRIRELLGIED